MTKNELMKVINKMDNDDTTMIVNTSFDGSRISITFEDVFLNEEYNEVDNEEYNEEIENTVIELLNDTCISKEEYYTCTYFYFEDFKVCISYTAFDI